VQEQLLIQTMQQKITQDVKVTPSEVFDYFHSIPKDSLPYISAEVEIGRIVKKPILSEDSKIEAKKKAEELRQRVLNGDDFSFLASVYSDDPGSAAKGGELGFFKRGTMVPEFDAVAFRLKNKGDVSEVFETQYGYHFMQLIERRGEEVNVRHILIKPKSTRKDLNRAKTFLDSVYQLITVDSLSFAKAAEKFSDEDESKNNEGIIINPNSGTTEFSMDELSKIDPTIFLAIDKMKPGEISKPTLTSSPDGSETYSIIYLKSQTEPHVANEKDDYQRLQDAALTKKKADVVDDWVKEKLADTYVKLDSDFYSCDFQHQWVKTEQ